MFSVVSLLALGTDELNCSGRASAFSREITAFHARAYVFARREVIARSRPGHMTKE
jgi:hypothetical protein